MPIPRALLPLAVLLCAPAAWSQQEGGQSQDRPMPRVTGASGQYESFRTVEPGGGPHLGRPVDSFSMRRYHVVAPRATERCIALPTEGTWRHRDLMREIQDISRHGLIPVLPVSGDVDLLHDSTAIPSGWKAYGFTVPGNGELEVRLEHPNLGWFRLAMVNKWGLLQQGMLQNLIPKGVPVVSFKNPRRDAQQVFVIADDPGWMSSKQLPYKLVIKRSWDGKKEGPSSLPQVFGIWAKQGGTTALPATAKPAPAPQDGKAESRP